MAIEHPITLAGWRGTRLEFPEWAPRCLVRKYQNMLPHVFPHHQECKDLLFRLITNSRMKRAWADIYKYRRDLFNGNEPPDYVEYLASSLHQWIENAFFKSNPTPVPKESRSKKYRAIAKAARKLSEAIDGSALDTTPYHWFPRYIVDLQYKTPFNCFEPSEPDQTSVHEVIDPEGKKLLNYGEREEYWRTAEQQKEIVDLYGLQPTYPPISRLLNFLARDAESLAAAMSYTKKVHKDSRRATRFIQALYPSWMRVMNGDCYGTLAKVCSVALDDSDIDEKTVKHAIGTPKKKGGVKTPKKNRFTG